MLAGAMAAGTPAPTLAQGVHIRPGGVGVDIGRPGYRERHYRGGVNDDYAYDRRYRGGCRTVTIDRTSARCARYFFSGGGAPAIIRPSLPTGLWRLPLSIISAE